MSSGYVSSLSDYTSIKLIVSKKGGPGFRAVFLSIDAKIFKPCITHLGGGTLPCIDSAIGF